MVLNKQMEYIAYEQLVLRGTLEIRFTLLRCSMDILFKYTRNSPI